MTADPRPEYLRNANRRNAAGVDEALAVFHFLMFPDEDSPMAINELTDPKLRHAWVSHGCPCSFCTGADVRKARDAVIANEREVARTIGDSAKEHLAKMAADPPEPRYVRARVEFSDTPDFHQEPAPEPSRAEQDGYLKEWDAPPAVTEYYALLVTGAAARAWSAGYSREEADRLVAALCAETGLYWQVVAADD